MDEEAERLSHDAGHDYRGAMRGTGSHVGPIGFGDGESPAAWRAPAARTLAIIGVLAYNWWAYLPVVAPDSRVGFRGLLSDLETAGAPDATTLSSINAAAGGFFLLAVLVRGVRASADSRRIRRLLLGFSLAVAIGALFPYACPEGLDAECRAQEWSFSLPLHHYVHMTAGIAEFATATFALLLAWGIGHRRTGKLGAYLRGARIALFVAYPLLVISYLVNAMGSVAEVMFFAVFSTLMLAWVFAEPDVPAEEDESGSADSAG